MSKASLFCADCGARLGDDDAAGLAAHYAHQCEVIAAYCDASGEYTTTRAGDLMTTVVRSGGGVEVMRFTLTRKPAHDGDDVTDYVLTDRFASSPDYPGAGMVWIDGDAYALEWADDARP